MEVIVDVRDGDMSKSKKHCRRAIRQQRRKRQLTWKEWWRRKILNRWYHCKARCNCLKACFNSPLSACFSQLSQPLLSAVKCHPTAQRGTNITGSKKMKPSFQGRNLDLLTTHCSHVTVAVLLSRAVTEPVLTLVEPEHLALTEMVDNKNLVGGGAVGQDSYLPPDTSSMMLHCSEEGKSPNQETSSFQRTTLALKKQPWAFKID